jgi:predicted Zn-dependent protease
MAANGYLTKLKRGEHQELINSEAQVPAEPLDLHHDVEQNELFPNQNDAGVDLSPIRWSQRGGVHSRWVQKLIAMFSAQPPHNSFTTAIKSARRPIGKWPKSLESLSRTPYPSTNQDSRLRCETDPGPTDHTSLQIGSGGKIKRWKKGTVLTFNMDSDSFLDVGVKDSQRAMDSLIQAAGTFNRLGLGVTLQCVDDSNSAVFQLVYSDDAPDGLSRTYAKAFFPGTKPKKRKLYVYALSFEPCSIDYLVNIFHHEIGHILGLHHELAHVKEPRDKSVRFGPKNRKSIMNSYVPSNLHVHDLDKTWLQKLYAYKKPVYEHLPVVDVSA